MQYKVLSSQELKALEKEFVQFLSANTVTKQDWEKLKKENPEKVEELIGVFSDIVWDKTLTNVKYLEFCTEKELKTFFCGEEKIYLRGLNIKSENGSFVTQSLNKLMELNKSGSVEMSYIKSDKAYKPTRNQEIFDMIQKGCTIGTPELFESLKID